MLGEPCNFDKYGKCGIYERVIAENARLRARIAELEAASQDLTSKLEQVEAEAAAMREALLNINELGDCDKCGQTYILEDVAEAKHTALATTAGAALLERMQKMEAVVEAAKEILTRYKENNLAYVDRGDDWAYLAWDDGAESAFVSLEQALAAVEEGEA